MGSNQKNRLLSPWGRMVPILKTRRFSKSVPWVLRGGPACIAVMPFDFRVWTPSWVDGWTGYVAQIASITCGNHMRLLLSSFDSFSRGLATIRPRWNRTHFTNIWLLLVLVVFPDPFLVVMIATKDRKSVSFSKLEQLILTGSRKDFPLSRVCMLSSRSISVLYTCRNIKRLVYCQYE